MSSNLRIAAIALLVMGVILRSPLLGGAAFILAGSSVVTAWWTRRVERGLRVRHVAPATIGFGDEATVTIEIANTSLLPVPWLQAQDSVPLALRIAPPVRVAFALGAGASRQMSYRVRGGRRGFYRLGPLRLTTGDVLGFYTRQLTTPAVEVTVFPRILPVPALGLPAQQAFGPLATRLRRNEDPARPVGVRPYQASDGVRRLDWKSSARHGELMVRRAEPSVAPETTIVLAFRAEDFPAHVVKDSLERAAVAAASLGAALLQRKLPVALVSNGIDPKNPAADVVLGSGKGDGHLQMLLYLLGRLEAGNGPVLWELVLRQQLPWGGTLVLIISTLDATVVPHVAALKRRGQYIVVYLLEPTPEALVLARSQGITAVPIDDRGVPMPLR